jgi:hypothetical protein
MFSVAYVGSVSRRLPYSGLGNSARHAYPAGTSTATVDADRPVPWAGAGLNYTLAIGRANYRGLETKFQRRFAEGWSALVSYTWSRTFDTGSGYFNVENGTGGSASIQNYWDQSTAWGPASYSIPHFASAAVLYELPFGKGKRWLQSGAGSWILGNWQTNFIAQGRTGAPYNLVITGDLANLRGSGSSAPNNYLRPNQIADPFVAGAVPGNPDPLCQKTISQGGRAADQVRTITTWFNPCAFVAPFGAFGTFPRNALRGSNVYNVDLSLFRSFPISERFKLQFRMEAFNVFNIQSWDVPSSVTINAGTATLNGVTYGTVASGVGRITGLAQGKTPRQIQFGLRLSF